MKLVTKELERELLKFPFGSQEYTSLKNRQVICKFFNAYGIGTWYVLEAKKLSAGDWLFNGWADLGFGEVGMFTLKELEAPHMCGIPMVERDVLFESGTLLKEYVDVESYGYQSYGY